MVLVSKLQFCHSSVSLRFDIEAAWHALVEHNARLELQRRLVHEAQLARDIDRRCHMLMYHFYAAWLHGNIQLPDVVPQ